MRTKAEQPTMKEVLFIYMDALFDIRKDINYGCFDYIFSVVVLWNRIPLNTYR
jgi:hypothetical protein